ncbi:MAG: neutral/alkaline non-lysosomal ceramidase N-terminal domain-containing protein [Caldilineaceae bacterium]
MLAGVAQIEITPSAGIALSGYIARRGPALGAHDPLYAKALVLDNGATQAALVTVDVLGLPRSVVANVRAAIAAQTGIPAANILIACSHTHAGPATMVLQGCGEVDPAYLQTLQERIVAVTTQAWANRRPARFGVGHGQVTAGVHNRRNPGAVIDPDLAIVRVDDTDGRPLAVLLNYACHPTCVTGENQLFSAEYCGYAAARIQQATDAITLFFTGAITLFFTGAIGDVGPSRRGWDVLELIGDAVAEEALRVLPTIAVTEWQTLTSVSRAVELPLQPLPTVADLAVFTAEQQRLLADAERMQQPYQPQIVAAMLNWTAATLTTVTAPAAPTTVTTEIQAIRAGDLCFVSAPGELFVELGLAVKADAPTDHLFLCGFGNDNIGYIPTPHAYPQGGYEIADAYKYYRYPAALAPEAGQHYVATAVELLY